MRHYSECIVNQLDEDTQQNKVLFKSFILGLIVILFSLGFRFFSLNKTGYWIDEMSSIHFAGHEYWGALLWDNSPPLYHFLLKIWLQLFGDSEIATRSLSALFSFLTTLLWMREGFRRQGPWGMALAGIIHASLGLSIWYAHEVRMYSLFELASTLFVLYIVAVLENRNPSKKFLFPILLFLLLTHYLSIIPITVGFIVLLLFKKKEVPSFYRQTLFFGLIASMLLISFIRWDSLSWQISRFNSDEFSRWPLQVLLALFAGWIGFLAFFLVSGIQIYSKNLLAKFGVLNLLVSFLIATLTCFALQRSVFLPRYYIYAIPMLMLVFISINLSESIKHNKLKLFQFFAVFIFIVCQIISSIQVINTPKPLWNKAADIISSTENAQVYTTRPLSLRSPYFDRYQIPFTAIGEDLDKALVELYVAKEAKKNIWILENYWGYHNYKSELDKFMNLYGCPQEAQILDNQSDDIIYLFPLLCQTELKKHEK